ncbi:GntR family transcriptional regulator [Corynebacterium occultum]|nr:GntR family transcriptional regulator [Corynebacterium occultum]
MPASTSFASESLSERVKRIIVDRVIEGAYPPGTHLVELQLAEEFGVSQAPVREALRELSSTRLVENRPRRGTYVRSISPEELAEIYMVRVALEGTAAFHAFPTLHQDPSPLREALTRMREAVDAGSARGLAKYSTQFHRAIIEASGNRLMVEIWDSLFVEVRTMATIVRGQVDPRAAAESHAPIVEAFETGDAQLCQQLVAEHQQEYSILPHE